jgi:HPt (histidine-containing phosphotransfer) domain-containing protein
MNGAMAVVLDTEQLTNVTMGDSELMRELVSALVEDTAQHVDLIRMAVGCGDSKRCARLAHSAKGACANLGARAMADALRGMEYNAAQGDLAECDRRISALSAELAALRDRVNGL